MARILVVDDARIMRETVREILEPGELAIAGEARDGFEAVQQFEALRPDAVLLDLVMPGQGGIASLRAIRAIDPAARVVVSCSLGQEALAREALRRGAAGAVAKPFQPEALVRGLRGALAKPPPRSRWPRPGAGARQGTRTAVPRTTMQNLSMR